MFKFLKPKTDRVRQNLVRKVAELQSECEALRRVVAIKDCELEHLGAIIARDRQRVLAETAEHTRRRAELEGINAK